MLDSDKPTGILISHLAHLLSQCVCPIQSTSYTQSGQYASRKDERGWGWSKSNCSKSEVECRSPPDEVELQKHAKGVNNDVHQDAYQDAFGWTNNPLIKYC